MFSRHFSGENFAKKHTNTRGVVTKVFPWDIEIPFSERDNFFLISNTTDSLFKLAKKYYDDEHAWWILIVANKDKNYKTPWDISIGDVIRIPYEVERYRVKVKEYYNRRDTG